MRKNFSINEMRAKAAEKREEIYNNPDAVQEEKDTIDSILEFLKYEDSFNKVSRPTVFAMLDFLGYTRDEFVIAYYDDLYTDLMREANTKYTLVDPGDIKR